MSQPTTHEVFSDKPKRATITKLDDGTYEATDGTYTGIAPTPEEAIYVMGLNAGVFGWFQIQ